MSGSEERLDQPLPEAVRQHVVELAADILGTLPAHEVPPPLQRLARFEPRKRARLAATPIAVQLENDPAFRERVGQSLRDAWPDLVTGLESGVAPAAAEPAVVAAAAYLLRPSGWVAHIETVRQELARSAATGQADAAEQTVARLRDELAAAKANGKKEADRLRAELRSVQAQIGEVRRQLHEARERAKAAERSMAALQDAAVAERAQASSAAASAEVELRRTRDRLAAAEKQLEAVRRDAREERSAADTRLRVLLDALVDAAQGIRRELALPSTIGRPADTVHATSLAQGHMPAVPARALADDDPALLDHLLTLPRVHVIVDGYNVTKTGYGSLPLADQRDRLLSGLAALAARTGAEITCVFDAAEMETPIHVPTPRGVRVLFTAPGEIADELILRLVRAEPAGRAVVVVSSDWEVARDSRRAGARPLPAPVLLRRLDRG